MYLGVLAGPGEPAVGVAETQASNMEESKKESRLREIGSATQQSVPTRGDRERERGDGTGIQNEVVWRPDDANAGRSTDTEGNRRTGFTGALTSEAGKEGEEAESRTPK